jgi:hypothetical protein
MQYNLFMLLLPHIVVKELLWLYTFLLQPWILGQTKRTSFWVPIQIKMGNVMNFKQVRKCMDI